MKVKELKEELDKWDDDLEVALSVEMDDEEEVAPLPIMRLEEIESEDGKEMMVVLVSELTDEEGDDEDEDEDEDEDAEDEDDDEDQEEDED